MMSVDDVFYSGGEEPVRVLGSSYGHGSRYSDRDYSNSPRLMHQYSRGRDGAYHNEHRYSRSSISPPRDRESITGLNIRDRLFGRKRSVSPPSSRQSWYRENRDSFGRNAYSPPGRYHGSHHTDYRTAESESYASAYGYGSGYASSDIYHGQHTSTVPRTYQSSSYYNQYGSNAYGLHTVRLKVPICCEACEERITNHLLDMEGVQSVTCDQIKQKVVVTGSADPAQILRASKECFKHSKYWRD
ncbi:hypothetical protein R1flu_007449 [Riccia fluitans]|uniref:HMA domain-containing protein n=1 Tax=Riccia fluitans TaxID=41844 RepID=A0ABD1YZ54_9MARC